MTPLATPYGTHVLVYYHQLVGNPALGRPTSNGTHLGIAAAVLFADTAKVWLPTRPLTRAFGLGLGATATGFVALGVALFTASAVDAFAKSTPAAAIAATASYAASHPCVDVIGSERLGTAVAGPGHIREGRL